MPRNKLPGLKVVGSTWHIDKRIKGYGRLCESTGCGADDYAGAERYALKRIEEIRQQVTAGVRPAVTWRDAATHYLTTETKRSLSRDAQDLAALDAWIGDAPLDRVHLATLQPYIDARLSAGVKVATVNRALAIVRRILNLAARLWRHPNGMAWLATAPMIRLLKPPADGTRKPYPLTWDEQDMLFAALPGHLERMAMFKVNTGTREQEVCGLRWAWEVQLPALRTSAFIIPGEHTKNGQDRLVVLNREAKAVIESVRGQHDEFVFTVEQVRDGEPERHPVTRILNSGWKRARRDAARAYTEATGLPAPAGFAKVRVHDLKHTFGRRLRAAGVSFEDRQDLLGHKSARVTTHYSAAEIGALIEAANKALSRKAHATVMLRVIEGGASG